MGAGWEFLHACTLLWCLYPVMAHYQLRYLRRSFFRFFSQYTNIHTEHWEVGLEFELTHLPVAEQLRNRARWDNKIFQFPAVQTDIACLRLWSEKGGKKTSNLWKTSISWFIAYICLLYSTYSIYRFRAVGYRGTIVLSRRQLIWGLNKAWELPRAH